MRDERRVPKYSTSGSLILTITTFRKTAVCVSKSQCWDFSIEEGQPREQNNAKEPKEEQILSPETLMFLMINAYQQLSLQDR